MFKEWPPLNPGSGGITESSRKIEKTAAKLPEVQEERAARRRRRELPAHEREVEILRCLENHDLDMALRIADRAAADQKPDTPHLVRFIYDEYLRRGDFLAAARLAHMRLTEVDVHQAAIRAYHAAKENSQPIEKIDPPPASFDGYVSDDLETPDYELIKREFGLSDEELDNLPEAA